MNNSNSADDVPDEEDEHLRALIREANKRRCRKNRHHLKFVHVDNLSVSDLPEGYRDKDLLECLRVCWQLTVKIHGRFVSSDRPERYQNSRAIYNLSDHRGSRINHNGSGWVWNVTRGRREDPCPCCGPPVQYLEWAAICVSTSNHVIFDTDEAKQALVQLFYDKEDTPNVLSMNGFQVIFKNTEEDRCLFFCITHDMDLVRRLEDLICNRDRLLCAVNKKYSKAENPKPVFIISYPHGCSKLISMGSILERHPTGFSTYCYKYNAPTCTGSSGGLMWPVGRWFQFQILVHMMAKRRDGVSENRSGMRPLTILEQNARLPNRLVNSTYFQAVTSEVYPESQPCDILHDEDGNDTAMIGRWRERRLRDRNFHRCRKNLGHFRFHNVDSFQQHIPQQYQSPGMKAAIDALAKLTVHVKVISVSKDRPDNYTHNSRGNIAFPFTNWKGRNLIRVGSGWLWDVSFFGKSRSHDPCSCQSCSRSGTPSQHWAKLKIVTAAHVVFDTSEAETATVTFFYDSEDGLEDLQLQKFKVSHCDIVSDICMMEVAICDMTFANTLHSLVEQRASQLHVIESQYRHTGAGGLIVVISHPHGVSKKVTFGQCIRYTESQSYVLSMCSLAYDTDTCPGSSGGVVWLVGSSKKGSYHLASHSGQLSSKKNVGGGEFMVCRQTRPMLCPAEEDPVQPSWWTVWWKEICRMWQGYLPRL